jgi:thioredoxin-dependent peroxiredoxin
MAKVTHKGSPIRTSGELPAIGSKAPDFVLTKGDLSDVGLGDFAGMVKILSIVPSLDTSTCALSAKKFDAEAGGLKGVAVLNVSRDLPFAQSRFCKAEGVDTVITLSDLRDRSFGKAYGVVILDGKLAGLLARAVVVLDASDRVVYTEQVPEIGSEPNYAAALDVAKKASARG